LITLRVRWLAISLTTPLDHPSGPQEPSVSSSDRIFPS
jgi:hypothetical protein